MSFRAVGQGELVGLLGRFNPCEEVSEGLK